MSLKQLRVLRTQTALRSTFVSPIAVLFFAVCFLVAVRATGRSVLTERVSVSTAVAQASADSLNPSLSSNGQTVAFESLAPNLVTGDTNARRDIFVRDRQGPATERVSVGDDGAQANADSFNASVSGDGRFIAFESLATNLIAGDTNARRDVFVRDRIGGTTERVSVATGGGQANGDSFNSSIS